MSVDKLLRLVIDPRFIEFKELVSKPNMFHIVGRTHTETWHSMFLGWLLDPKGSHSLGDFPVRRFLGTLAGAGKSTNIIVGDDVELDKIIQIAALGNFSRAVMRPNEREQKEMPLEGGGWLDGFMEDIRLTMGGNTLEAVLLIEQKVADNVKPNQLLKYSRYLNTKHHDRLQIKVVLAPESQFEPTTKEAFGDETWCGIDYQALHDEVLLPCLENPNLSAGSHALITQYVDVLRVPSNNLKLAITAEEKDLADEIDRHHHEALNYLQNGREVMKQANSKEPARKLKEPLAVELQGQTITGQTVKDFYLQALKAIKASDTDFENHLPYSTSKQRYLIATEPYHPGGNPFYGPIEYDGLAMESHKSRNDAVRHLVRFLEAVGLEATEVEAQLIEEDSQPPEFPEEELQFIQQIYERDAITFKALSSMGIRFELDEADEEFPLEFEYGERKVTGSTVPKFYENILRFLVEESLIQKLAMPIHSSPKRYLISTGTVHPSGVYFERLATYAGYYMEANRSRRDASKALDKLEAALDEIKALRTPV